MSKRRALCNGLAAMWLLSFGIATADSPTRTPTGALRAASADGRIPAWQGGLDAAQEALATVATGPVRDPFAGDEVLETITAANAAQYSASLSAGHLALLRKYPDYRLPVYPTRRSARFPKPVLDAIAGNATSARLVGVDAIEGARLGIPFPQPKSGVEVLWNHRLRYHGDSIRWTHQTAVVSPQGIELQKASEQTLYRYANVANPADLAIENVFGYSFLRMSSCESYRGAAAGVWHDPVNALAKARRLWVFAMGRSLRTPPLGYDEVGLCSRFIRYFDMLDMFSGGFDRYAFKLIGQRQMYVPYNSYRLGDGRSTVRAQLGATHFNQADTRYELHRVWVVEASLRPGQRHALARRLFFVDEDSWSILLVDGYNAEGRLVRFQEGHLLPLYPAQGVDYAPLLTYDLAEGRYFADRLLSGSPAPTVNLPNLDAGDFTPAAAQRQAATR